VGFSFGGIRQEPIQKTGRAADTAIVVSGREEYGIGVPWRVDSLTDELVVSGGIVSGGDSVRARMRRAAETALLTANFDPVRST
jgi:hypothetical protein